MKEELAWSIASGWHMRESSLLADCPDNSDVSKYLVSLGYTEWLGLGDDLQTGMSLNLKSPAHDNDASRPYLGELSDCNSWTVVLLQTKADAMGFLMAMHPLISASALCSLTMLVDEIQPLLVDYGGPLEEAALQMRRERYAQRKRG